MVPAKRPPGRKGRRFKSFKHGFRPKVCRFCTKPEEEIDYKNAGMLRHFMTDRGKILSRMITGNCAKHQRKVTRAIKRARNIGLLPFVVK